MREYDFRKRYIRELWRRVARDYSAIAIFGGGAHTKWLFSATRDIDDGPNVVAVLDESPAHDSIEGVPVVELSEMPDRVEAVLVSSDSIEAKLAARVRQVFADRVAVIEPYEGIDPGPFAYELHDVGARELSLVCDKYRFVCVINAKVATVSFREWLVALNREPDDVDRDYRNDFGDYRDYSLAKLDRHMPRDYFKFSFVRNPWTRMVAAYHESFVKAANRVPRSDCERVWKQQIGYTSGMTFREFVTYVDETGDILDVHWTPQSRLLTQAPVDFVGRYERLHEDFETVKRRVGVSRDLPARNVTRYEVESTHASVSDVAARDFDVSVAFPHFTRFYDIDLVDRVGRIYAGDVDMFGYEPPDALKCLTR